MNIRKYEPWSILDLFDRDFLSFAGQRPALADTGTIVADWLPAVDIVEHSDRFVLHADVPGVDPEKIEVSMDGGVLSLSGERHDESTEQSDGLKRVERISGKFYRRFSLPDSADTEGITARTKNGTLEVSIPKRPEVQARRITVKAA